MARPIAAHRRKSQIRGGLLAGLCLLAAPAWAQILRQELAVNGGYGFPGDPNFTEQNGTSKYAVRYASSDNSETAIGTVEISIRPAPYIISSISLHSPYGYFGFESLGRFFYNIEINGAANTYIPVNFRGAYDLSGAAYRRSVVGGAFQFGDATFDLAGGIDNASGTDHQWVYQNQQISLSESTSTHSQRAGNFFGSSSFLTDGNGHSTATVYLQASTNKHIYSPLGVSIQARAFIDPEFSIDPVWLAANPGTTLTFPAGVGNAVVQAVPEPETYALMLAGLGLVGAAVRRRKDRVSGPRLAAAPHATNPRSCESAA